MLVGTCYWYVTTFKGGGVGGVLIKDCQSIMLYITHYTTSAIKLYEQFL